MLAASLKPIVDAILNDYALPIGGCHGVAHWARVLENGWKLAEQTQASRTVVALFAVLHDSRRVNEGTDHDHGQRGADFAHELQGRLFDLPESEFELLFYACAGHTEERTHPDITIQTCWDADRLDLGRVGVQPNPELLCTDAARDRQMIRWADGRAGFRLVPSLVEDDWGISMPSR